MEASPEVSAKTYPVLIVTGLSGAGKSITLRTLEDFGCEVIDNLPVSLCSAVILQKPLSRPLALGIDSRTRDFDATQLERTRFELSQKGVRLLILFLEASSETIEQRYRETRRFHPLGSCGCLSERIQTEKDLLAPVRSHASIVLDTSLLSPPELRKMLQERFAFPSSHFFINLLSFSYRRGVPSQADMVLDMRFLTNPYYKKDLRFLTGKAASIQEYIGNDPTFQKFLSAFKELLLETMLPRFRSEGRREFLIAFGCTGGRHRSVCAAEAVSHFLKEQKFHVRIHHREIS